MQLPQDKPPNRAQRRAARFSTSQPETAPAIRMSPPKMPTEPPDPKTHLLWVRGLVGPGFIIGGWGLIPNSYWVGIVIVYIGFLLCLMECAKEPALAGHLRLRAALVVTVLGLTAAFSFGVVFISAPLSLESYAMRNGEYPSGTVIAGIAWDPHLTDLRVSITNPTNDDYHEVDLAVQPDKPTYKAAIVGNETGCQISSIGGNSFMIVPSSKGGATKVTSHRVGDKVEMVDNAGDVFEPVVTEGGYRLICAKLPAHFNVQIVFALASIKQEVIGLHAPIEQDRRSLGVEELKGSNKMFDFLGQRPSPSAVTIKGKLSRDVKTFVIQQTLQIADGN